MKGLHPVAQPLGAFASWREIKATLAKEVHAETAEESGDAEKATLIDVEARYSTLVFFPKLSAEIVSWNEWPTRRVYGYAMPKDGDVQLANRHQPQLHIVEILVDSASQYRLDPKLSKGQDLSPGYAECQVQSLSN